ncbi:MAG: iron-only hydrogenase system regulator [Candidatus Desulfofervidaceae bacterium]|nr:iron-only hydrogenase system regulator [Candidatus Desulfofervidaceae bacterium]
MERIGAVIVIIKDRKRSASKVNEILSQYGDIIIGRMGIPYRKKNLSIISLIVEGNTDVLGAMTGKLGMLEDVEVKSILVTK